jgi:lambda repressor-like predicted transcriptional regulator
MPPIKQRVSMNSLGNGAQQHAPLQHDLLDAVERFERTIGNDLGIRCTSPVLLAPGAARSMRPSRSWSWRGIVRGDAERARLIAVYKASGLSVQAFAKREGVPSSTLYQWLAKNSRPAPVLLARVIRRPSALGDDSKAKSASAGTPVAIQVDAVRVHVTQGFDRATLAAVLDVLDARAHQRAS